MLNALILCVNHFSEVYADHPEKRRKRGTSLFSRKKKDKSKTKGQSTNCDGKLMFCVNLFWFVFSVLF